MLCNRWVAPARYGDKSPIATVELRDMDAVEAGASRVEVRLTPTLDGTLVTVVEQPLASTGVSASASARADAVAATGAVWATRLLHLEALLLAVPVPV